MSRYEHLPIYKQAMDVAVHFEEVVAGFSRYHNYTLGADLRNESREIVAQIIRANAEREKAPMLLNDGDHERGPFLDPRSSPCETPRLEAV